MQQKTQLALCPVAKKSVHKDRPLKKHPDQTSKGGSLTTGIVTSAKLPDIIISCTITDYASLCQLAATLFHSLKIAYNRAE
ncbi:hypothetical protein [Dysgonomonas sp. 521]|uniref:hypothetical protein n=1 Tax=Dysgonomonas sp. 521 TaxID=2302932 RepID=UPI0013D78919|nr:hypothetical protein [Dysgonomonas sp. 521]